MSNHLPQAIANEFLRRRRSDMWPQQMFIQKLAYIAHGWNLAINGQPLIGAAPEAWDNGPVYRDIWDHIKAHGYRGPKHTLTEPFSGRPFEADLDPSEREVIEHVWRKYGSKRSDELSAMTHQPGTPWYKAYFGVGRNAELSNADIKEHYRQLARAARDRTAISADA